MIQGTNKSSEFPLRFQQEAIRLVNELIPASGTVFFLVDPKMQHKGIVLEGIDQETENAYQRKYQDLDPLHPSKISEDDRVLFLADRVPASLLHQSTYYKEFLQPRGIEHVADMFFRQEDQVIAVLAMLRESNLPPFNRSDMKQLLAIQAFLEYAINTVYLPERLSQRKSIAEKFGLTDRELDVLEWLMSGAENKTIANELNISLATVKTHLNHIFGKFEVTTRSLLLRKLFAEFGIADNLRSSEGG